MKKTIAVCGITIDAYAQGGPNGNACNTPNPPPWCDQPTVPIDNWQLMLALIITALIIGYFHNKKWSIK